MRYYHVFDNKRSAGFTIAAELNRESPMRVDCAVSYCAPIEHNFSRSKGRMIAKSRLDSKKQMPLFKKFSFSVINPKGLKAQILSQLKAVLPLDWAYHLLDQEIERLYNIQKNLLEDLKRKK